MGAQINRAIVVSDAEAGIELVVAPVVDDASDACVRIDISLACAPECKGVLELDDETAKRLASAIVAARKESLK